MNHDVYREVDFEKYCKTCRYCDLDEKFDPCNECLEEGYNIESEKPIKWEENEK